MSSEKTMSEPVAASPTKSSAGLIEKANTKDSSETTLGRQESLDSVPEDDGSNTKRRPPFFIKRWAPPPARSMEDALLIPDITASWFSSLFFFWIQPMLALGYKRPLEKADLWKIDDARSASALSQVLMANFQKRFDAADEWNRRLDSGQYKPTVARRTLWRFLAFFNIGQADGRVKAGLAMALSDTFFWKFWSAGALKIVSDTLLVTSPLITKKIINYGLQHYEHAHGVAGISDPGIGYGVGLAIGLFAMQFVASLCMHQFFARSMEVGVFARGALISSIYRRALVLSGKSRATITNGKLVSHISTDASRIDFCAGFFHMSWTAPIQLILVIVILLTNMGASSLAGIGVLIIVMPLQAKTMRAMFALRKKSMVWTDRRVKLISELIGGIRVIKLFNWEVPYLNKISEYRTAELTKLRTLMILRASNVAVSLSLPVLATVVAFAVYGVTHPRQDPAIIFTSLTLFNLLRLPLMTLPMSLATITDAKTALNRLRDVYVAEEIDGTYDVDRELPYAVDVQDASFIWEGAPPEDIKLSKKKAKAEKKKQKKNSTELARMAHQDHDASAKPLPKDREVPTATLGGGSTEKEALTDGSTIQAPAVDHEELTIDEPESDEPLLQLRDINFRIPRGQLCAVIGSVGAGKSSLLQGLIGEMRRTKGRVTFGGSLGYAAQSAWIQNATLKDNIVFGQEWNEDRYNTAVEAACLQADIDMLPNGDQTEIGEKGINLSGGQKQRVNIARAIYFDADILCLDDPLSAVDAHVAHHIFTKAIKGVLKGKTIILVTHALHFLPSVDHILCVEDGMIVEAGNYKQLIANEGPFATMMSSYGGQELSEKEESIEKAEDALAPLEKKPAGPKARPLMVEEERAVGSVSGGVYAQYLKAANGVWLLPILIVVLVLTQGATVLTSYALVWWQRDTFNRPQGFYMGIYAALAVAQTIFSFALGTCALMLGLFASAKLHGMMAQRVMHAPMSWFDTVPTGRILGRFGKDIDTIDSTLNDSMRMALSTLGSVAGAIVLIAIIEPWFLLAVAAILTLYYAAANFYLSSAREIKRLDNLLRSGLYAHFSESLAGLATIRAYAESDRFLKRNEELVDTENRAYYLTTQNQRWLGVRLDLLGCLLTFSVAIISVVQSSLNPSIVGLILSFILQIQQAFTWAVRQIAEVGNDMTSSERILHYGTQIENEAPMEIEATKPAAEWPQQGVISMKHVELSYRKGLPAVLKDLSIDFKGGERVGIVGRTGAGKSSIMAALFRMVELSSGTIEIDGVDISKIGLGELRKKVAIIPQDALLFNGSIRTNLDPFSVHDDATLWDALRRSSLVDRKGKNEGDKDVASRFTLDTVIEDEGGNLSVGERSLVSLARALVKNARIVLLDEATASVDFETDELVQKTIATEMRGKTLLTIAHRLKTILSYDRILVMGDGKVLEFDTPLALFAQTGSFHSLCVQSNIDEQDIRNAQHA
ncbi:uncharacterized protein L969DRAFT_91604 [Mixia osmundae IAM 14324]|uniref:Uncharacterized protein n=1 Tax=Mixia osmundae (strain CBS 9802 / IAM 14324 / JCM 22182 / KY 12970) TaxID=764103 RepID=G7DZY9_MIXOS|nr:uncharacterized protein L969DRAFT_91604 [Mixia osmundae IAM 14324]KEI42141.1 hypothetical protein L969DRAFT_91604 [Mixia osmundae IAM 14324]GAA96149.1 hypothetical protein E5Q_02810 [Mixia osmundae IAM 14324]